MSKFPKLVIKEEEKEVALQNYSSVFAEHKYLAATATSENQMRFKMCIIFVFGARYSTVKGLLI